MDGHQITHAWVDEIQLSATDVVDMLMLAAVKKGVFKPGSLSAAKKFNPDWDPKLHPKDQEGKFVEKNKGTFIFGQNKTATYANDMSVDITYTLKPGEKAYANPSNSAVLIERADGSWDYVSSSQNKVGISENAFIVQKAQAGQLEQIDAAPSVEIEADTLDEAKAAVKVDSVKDTKDATPDNGTSTTADAKSAKPAAAKVQNEGTDTAFSSTVSTAAELDALSAGTKIFLPNGTVLTKLDNGKWKDDSNPTGYGKKSENLEKYALKKGATVNKATGGQVTPAEPEKAPEKPVEAPAPKVEAPAPKPVEKPVEAPKATSVKTAPSVNSVAELDAFATGTKITLPNGSTLTKIDNGKWKDDAKPTGYGSKAEKLEKFLKGGKTTVVGEGTQGEPTNDVTPEPEVSVEVPETPEPTYNPGEPLEDWEKALLDATVNPPYAEQVKNLEPGDYVQTFEQFKKLPIGTVVDLHGKQAVKTANMPEGDNWTQTLTNGNILKYPDAPFEKAIKNNFVKIGEAAPAEPKVTFVNLDDKPEAPEKPAPKKPVVKKTKTAKDKVVTAHGVDFVVEPGQGFLSVQINNNLVYDFEYNLTTFEGTWTKAFINPTEGQENVVMMKNNLKGSISAYKKSYTALAEAKNPLPKKTYTAADFPKTDNSPDVQDYYDVNPAKNFAYNKMNNFYYASGGAEVMDQYIANLLESTSDSLGGLYAADSSGWDKSEKAALTKAKNELQGIHNWGVLFQKYMNGEDLTKVEKSIISVDSFQNNNAFYHVYSYSQIYKTQKDFSDSLTDLPFSLTEPDMDLMVPWAKEKGLSQSHLASEAELLSWVKVQLGAPGLPYNEQSQANNLDEKLKSKATLQKLYDLAPSVIAESESSKQAAEALSKADAKQKKKYDFLPGKFSKNGDLYTYDSETQTYTSVSTTTILTRDDVVDLKGQYVISGSKGSIAGQANVAKYESAVVTLAESMGYEQETTPFDTFMMNFSSSEREQILTELGAAGAQHMSFSTQRAWLSAYLNDDKFLTRLIESAVFPEGHPDTDSPYNLNSPAGKQVAQTRLDELFQIAPNMFAMDKSMSEFTDFMYGDGVDEYKNAATAYNLRTNMSTRILFANMYEKFQELGLKPNSVTLSEYTYNEPAKPTNATDQDWALAKALTHDAKGSLNDELNAIYGGSQDVITEDNALKSYGVTQLEFQKLPTAAKKVLATYSDGMEGVKESLKTLAKSGYFSQPTDYVWAGPNDKKYQFDAGTSIYAFEGGKFGIFPPGQDTPSFLVQGENNNNIYMGYSLSNFTKGKGDVVWSAPKPKNGSLGNGGTFNDYKDSEFAVGTPSESQWAMVEYTLDPSNTLPAITALPDGYLNISNPGLAAALPNMTKHAQDVVTYFANADYKPGLAIMDYKVANGAFGANEGANETKIDAPEPFLNPHAPYAHLVGTGKITPFDIKNWPADAFAAASKDFGEADPSELADKIATFVGNGQQAYSGTKLTTASGMPVVLDLKKTNKSLDGMHSKTVWKDQLGNEWMSKAFPSDSNGPARVDAEYAATQIGTLFGFNTPETRLLKLEGNYAYVQHLAPADGHLRYDSPATLNDEQLSQAMEEHILDWLVSNHDSHAGNLLKAPDGKSIIGIDKGQAFRFFPDDKLAVGYLPPSNPEPVWYDQFYNGVMNGSISEERANLVAIRVLSKASRLAKKNDAEYRALLEKALGQRTFWPDEHPDKDSFIDALMERKQNVLTDFEALYQGVFKKSPYDYKIDAESLTAHKVNDDTFVALHPEYTEEVKKAGTYGKALFFAGQDISDGHALNYTEVTPTGTDLVGQMKLRYDADNIVTKWFEKQTIVSEYGGTTNQAYSPTPYVSAAAEPQHSVLPYNGQIYSALYTFAKTVNTHANGNGDYNPSTVANANAMLVEVDEIIEDLETHIADKPTEVYPSDIKGAKLLTHEQQDAYLAALKQYSSQFKMAQTAMEQGVKIYSIYPPEEAKFQQATYEASPAAKLESSDVKFTWTDYKGASVFQTEDNGYFATNVLASGKTKTTKISKTLYESTITNPLFSKVGEAPESNDAVTPDNTTDVQVTKDIGTKELKIFKRAATGTKGEFDPETGLLKYLGKANNMTNSHINYKNGFVGDGEYEGYSGAHYEIEFGDNIVIDYKPAKDDHDTNLSQRRWLHYRIKDWNGSATDLDDVYDIVRQMGVDLTPADETSLELHYWRHMYGVLQDRIEGSEPSSKWAKTKKAIQDAWAADPGMSAASELKMLKDAWALSMGEDIVKNAKWEPQYERLSPLKTDQVQGTPFWYRPDMTPAELKAASKSKVLYSNYNTKDAKSIASSGGFFSTEERLRLLGKWLARMSSADDQSQDGANVVFTRQGREIDSSDNSVVAYHPRVMLRTQNYSFYSDFYGNSSKRAAYSHFDLEKAVIKGNGGNAEFNVKNQIGLLDNVVGMVIPDAKTRNEIIASYKARGVFTINGIPVEQVFASDAAQVKKNVAQAWDDYLKKGK